MSLYKTKKKLEILEKDLIVDFVNDVVNLYEVKDHLDYKITNPKELLSYLKHEYLEKIQEIENPGQTKMEF